MKVKALKVTFTGGRAQNVGDVFEVTEKGFNPVVMEKVGDTAQVSRPTVKRAYDAELPPSGTGRETATEQLEPTLDPEIEMHAVKPAWKPRASKSAAKGRKK